MRVNKEKIIYIKEDNNARVIKNNKGSFKQSINPIIKRKDINSLNYTLGAI